MPDIKEFTIPEGYKIVDDKKTNKFNLPEGYDFVSEKRVTAGAFKMPEGYEKISEEKLTLISPEQREEELAGAKATAEELKEEVREQFLGETQPEVEPTDIIPTDILTKQRLEPDIAPAESTGVIDIIAPETKKEKRYAFPFPEVFPTYPKLPDEYAVAPIRGVARNLPLAATNALRFVSVFAPKNIPFFGEEDIVEAADWWKTQINRIPLPKYEHEIAQEAIEKAQVDETGKPLVLPEIPIHLDRPELIPEIAVPSTTRVIDETEEETKLREDYNLLSRDILEYVKPQKIWNTFWENAPLTGTLALAYTANPALGSAIMVAIEGGSMKEAVDLYEEETGEELSFKQRNLIPIAVGAINAALERTGIETILGRGLGKYAKRRITRGLISAGVEAGTEGLQELNSVFGELGFDEEAQKGMTKRVFEGFYGGLITGGIMSGAISGVAEITPPAEPIVEEPIIEPPVEPTPKVEVAPEPMPKYTPEEIAKIPDEDLEAAAERQIEVIEAAEVEKEVSVKPTKKDIKKPTAITPIETIETLAKKYDITDKSKDFIVGKVKELGSIEAVNKKYKEKTDTDNFAKDLSKVLFEKPPAFEEEPKIIYDENIAVEGYYDEKTNIIYISKKLAPERRKEVIKHELEHVKQKQEGKLPTSYYVPPEKSIKSFMEYFTDPGEVSARAVEKGEPISEIWQTIFDLRRKPTEKAISPLEIEKLKPVETIKYVPDKEMSPSEMISWQGKRLTGKLTKNDPKAIEKKTKSLRIYFKNQGNGIIAESELKNKGIEAFSHAPFSVDIVVDEKNISKMREIGFELILPKITKMLPHALSTKTKEKSLKPEVAVKPTKHPITIPGITADFYPAAMIDLVDAKTRETIKQGEPFYHLIDTDENVSLETFTAMARERKAEVEDLFGEEVERKPVIKEKIPPKVPEVPSIEPTEVQISIIPKLEKKIDMFEEAKKKVEGKDLAFNPKNLEYPDTDKFNSEADNVVKRSEIAKNISDQLDVPIRNGKFIGKALGIFKAKPEIIRIKAGNILTISHEVGHFLDKSIPDTFSTKLKLNEMNALLKEYDVDIKTINKHKEAFGEFLRFYVTEHSKARLKAPTFYKYFERTIDKYPEIKDVLLKTRRDYRRWLDMPATAKVLSQISMKEKKENIKEKISHTVEEIYKTTLDDLYPLKQFVDRAKKKGTEVEAEENPYILSRVLKGWVSKANIFLEKATFNKKFWRTEKGKIVPEFTGKSFKNILRPVEKKMALENLSIYLTSRRAIELNRRGINTGIDTKDANQAVNELNLKYPEFENITKELYKFQDAILNYGLQSNLYDEELLKRLKFLNKQYVPFYRVFEELNNQGHFGKGLANISNQIKRIRGSEREIINPLESIVKNTYAIINAADRNQIGIMMANLASKDKELARLFEEIPTPIAKVAQVKMEDLGIDIDGLNEEDMDKVVDIFRPSLFVPKDNVLTVMMKGKKRFFQVDPDIYKAMMATERETMGLMMKIFSTPTRWLRAGAILAPEFAVRNPLRDVMTAYCYSNYGFVPIIDNIKGIFSLVKKDNDYLLWKMGGGEHSMMVSMDRQYLQKSFDEIVKGKGFTNYIKSPLETLRIISELSEKLNRLPEAKLALAKGKSPIEAGYASREITLDFAKGGATGRSLNRLIAFWKANALGWEKMVTSFKNHPTRTSAKVFAGITIPSIVLYLINRDDDRWKEIPQWQKNLFWIIMTDDNIYRIPKPFELGILFGSVPERMLEYIDNKDPKVIKNLADTIIHGQSPGIIPTALLPIIENATNYNLFLSRPIVPGYRKELPPEAQYTGYTSEIAKKLGKLAHYSPAKIDNLFRGYFAGLGRYATDGIDKILTGTGISPKIPEPSSTLADQPIIRAFVVRRPIGSASESVNRFYEKIKEYTADEKMLKQYINNDNKEEFYKYKEKHPDIYFTYDWKTKTYYSIPARYYRAIARRISELRKKERKIYESKTMTSEEKRSRINEVDSIISELAQKALKFEIK